LAVAPRSYLIGIIVLALVAVALAVFWYLAYSGYTSLEARFNELRVNYTMLQSNYTSLRSLYSGLQASYNSLQSSYGALKAQYGSLTVNYTGLRQEYSKLQLNYTSLEQSYSTLQSNYSSLMKQYSSLNELYSALKVNYTTLQSQYATLQHNYTTLNQTYSELNVTYTTLLLNYTLLLNKTTYYQPFMSLVQEFNNASVNWNWNLNWARANDSAGTYVIVPYGYNAAVNVMVIHNGVYAICRLLILPLDMTMLGPYECGSSNTSGFMMTTILLPPGIYYYEGEALGIGSYPGAGSFGVGTQVFLLTPNETLKWWSSSIRSELTVNWTVPAKPNTVWILGPVLLPVPYGIKVTLLFNITSNAPMDITLYRAYYNWTMVYATHYHTANLTTNMTLIGHYFYYIYIKTSPGAWVRILIKPVNITLAEN
jgi:prefoldin subunit 5